MNFQDFVRRKFWKNIFCFDNIVYITLRYYNLTFDKGFDLESWSILKNLDFFKILLLGLSRIRGEILEIFAYFLLVCFFEEMLLRGDLLNYTNILFLSAVSLSYPAL